MFGEALSVRKLIRRLDWTFTHGTNRTNYTGLTMPVDRGRPEVRSAVFKPTRMTLSGLRHTSSLFL
jgi:hypothetical protein